MSLSVEYEFALVLKLNEDGSLTHVPGADGNTAQLRFENLEKELCFKNLTYAPIDLDLINFKLLTDKEKKYLFEYHLDVYSKISKFLNEKERKWLINLIK